MAFLRVAAGLFPMALASLAGLLAGIAGIGAGSGAMAGATLRPASALLVLVMAGAVVLALRSERRPALRRGGLLLGSLVGSVCLVSLVHAVTGIGEGWPGLVRALHQISLPASLALLAAAVSLWLRWGPRSPSWPTRQAAAIVALIPFGVGLLGSLAFLSGMPLLYGTQRMPMSLPAGFGALLLGLSLILAAGTDTWPLALFRLRHPEDETTAARWFAHGPLGLFLLGAMGILVGGSLYLRGQIRTSRQGAERELAAVGNLKVRQIAQWYEERREDGEQIFRAGLIQTQLDRFLAGGPQAPPAAQILSWMRSLQNGTYGRIVLLDAQGRTRLSVPPEESGKGFEPGPMDAARFQEALHGRKILIQDLHRDAAQGAIHLSVWVPIGVSGIVGEPAHGVLLLMVDPSRYLFPLVQEWPGPSASAETQLVRREGDSVVFLNDMRNRPGTALVVRLSLASHRDRAGTQAAEGKEGRFEGLDYRGIPVLAVIRQVPGTPWALVSNLT